MEKLAEALPHLQEDDLLQVVQMVHDNKSEETYTKNDLESKYSFGVVESVGMRAATEILGDVLTWLCNRRRIPRRSLHTPGQSHQDALGLHLESRRHGDCCLSAFA